ncbi:MAG TPA: hypothetical protein VN739_03865 [Nitrososphaerales archaeon]|nr:hypothetical protein [Nitrososphaerales archaeon]
MLLPFVAIPAPTLSEFGIWYFVFGLFVALGFVMLGIILLADPDEQYDIDSLKDLTEDEIPADTKLSAKTR